MTEIRQEYEHTEDRPRCEEVLPSGLQVLTGIDTIGAVWTPPVDRPDDAPC